MFDKNNGLSSTHAQHLCNVSNDKANALFREMMSMTVCGKRIPQQTTGDITCEEPTFDGEKFINLATQRASHMTLNAYLRSAIETKQKMIQDVYVRADAPEAPSSPEVVDMEWALNQLSIRERQEYLAAESQAASIGKLIHERSSITNSLLRECENKPPYKHMNYGSTDIMIDLIDYVDVTEIESVINRLQSIHREHNSVANRYKARMHNAVTQENARRNAEYIAELTEYKAKMAELGSAQEKEVAEIGALKIVVPDALKGLIDEEKSGS